MRWAQREDWSAAQCELRRAGAGACADPPRPTRDGPQSVTDRHFSHFYCVTTTDAVSFGWIVQ